MRTPYTTRDNATCEDCGSPAALRCGGLPILCSEHFAKRQSGSKARDAIYCTAVGRRQFEAATWGASNVGCSNRASVIVTENGETYPVCHVHADATKRYGWNR